MRHCSRRRFFSSLTLFSLSSACLLRSSTLCLMVVRQELRSWACSLQVFDRLHSLRSLDTTSFHRRFCPPADRLLPTGADTRSCFGRRLLGIRERCPRKRRRHCVRMDEILCCLAILQMVVWRFYCLTEIPRIIRRQRITKDSRRRT